MRFRDLDRVAKGESWYEEVSGQLWLERRELLARINALEPGGRREGARRELRLLRRRVDRERRLDSRDKLTFFSRWDDVGGLDVIERHTVRKW